MKIAEIDRIATQGCSCIHRATILAKIALAFLLLASLLLAKGLIKLSLIILCLFLFFFIARVPWQCTAHLVLYPVFFASFFALTIYRGFWELGLTILLRAVGAAMTMLFLFATTSYVDLFAFISRFLPVPLVDIFFFTYRSLFILLAQLENFYRTLQLKGGFQLFNLLHNVQNVAGMLGALLVRSFEMSERMYYIYSLRGYSGKRLSSSLKKSVFSYVDIILIAVGLIIFSGAVLPWSNW
ncbi:MAG: hypothetical protein GX767_07730 [Firmicutes bacterium]|nr:hypothetical protein [Bacillota bacterium]